VIITENESKTASLESMINGASVKAGEAEVKYTDTNSNKGLDSADVFYAYNINVGDIIRLVHKSADQMSEKEF
jgi:hypothetical protein